MSILHNFLSAENLFLFSLMQLLIPTLYHVKYPAEKAKGTSVFNLGEKPEIVQQLLDFMLDVLLMPYGYV